jgi:hypothetical protein
MHTSLRQAFESAAEGIAEFESECTVVKVL